MGSILHNITDFDYTRWITPDQVSSPDASLSGATTAGHWN
jgi:hypothetical protein